MKELKYDTVIIGSGCGGGTIAEELSDLCNGGEGIVVLERGPKFQVHEFTGNELEMAQMLYAERGGFLNKEKTMTLAFVYARGGTTKVYTGTSLLPEECVIDRWNVPGLTLDDIKRRAKKYIAANNIHLLPKHLINENNRLFFEGCRKLGLDVKQFPLNIKGCQGSGFCNLGCPNGAKQGTDEVQLLLAEERGVKVVTRCEVLQIDIEGKAVIAEVTRKSEGGKGDHSPWEPGMYRIQANRIVVSAGVVNTPAILLRSGLGEKLPLLGHGLTCHPAIIAIAKHNRDITNFVGHPKSYYLDHAERKRYVLETCMYFPFTTAKSMTGFGEQHSAFMNDFSRLQMILILACDTIDPHNRITIDKNGKPVVHYRFTPEVVQGLVQGSITSAKIFFAAGAERAHIPVANPPLVEAKDIDRIEEIATVRNFKAGKISVFAAHFQGGCGMGRTARDSVTDAYGRVHGIPGLYVGDASLFPNALGINPHLTIMAVANRVAEGIYRDMN